MRKTVVKNPDELKLSFLYLSLFESPESSVYRWKIVMMVFVLFISLA